MKSHAKKPKGGKSKKNKTKVKMTRAVSAHLGLHVIKGATSEKKRDSPRADRRSERVEKLLDKCS